MRFVAEKIVQQTDVMIEMEIIHEFIIIKINKGKRER